MTATTKLLYSFACSPFPLKASPASRDFEQYVLEVVATNPSQEPSKNPVTVEGVSIKVPLGEGAGALAPDATEAVPIPPTGWTLQKDTGPGVFVFVPSGGKATVGGGNLVFAIAKVPVNRKAGSVVGFTVTEGSDGCEPPACPSQELPVEKFPAGWGAVQFSVDPPDINAGEPTTLTWSGPEGATYEIEYAAGGRVVKIPPPGGAALSNIGVYPGVNDPPLQPAETTTFTLTVADEIDKVPYGAQIQQTVTVVKVAKITEFKGVLNETADPPGYELTLGWKTEGVDYCLLDDNPDKLDSVGSEKTALEAPWVASHTLQAIPFDGAQPLSSTLEAQWGERENVSLPNPSGMAALSADATRLYVVAPGASVQEGFISAIELPSSSSSGYQVLFTAQRGIRGIAAAAANLPGDVWAATNVHEGPDPWGNKVELELLAFAADGTPEQRAQVVFRALTTRRASIGGSPDGSTVYVSPYGEVLYAYQVSSDMVLTRIWDVVFSGTMQAVESIAVGADGILYLALNLPDGPSIQAFDPANPPPAGPIAISRANRSLQGISVTEDKLYVESSAGLEVLDRHSLELLYAPPAPASGFGSSAIGGPNGLYIYTVGPGPWLSVFAPCVSGGVTS